MCNDSKCFKCKHYPSGKLAKVYCTHYMLSPEGICSRDFELFPIGWSVNKVKNFVGVPGGQEFGMIEGGDISISEILEMEPYF